MKIKYFVEYWIPIIIYMGFIYYLSSLSNPIDQIIPERALIYFDFEHFIYHIIEFGILSLLLYRALKTIVKNPQILAVLITILYAITDEIHQCFVSGRISSTFDVMVDAFGAVAMQCIVNVYNWLKNNSQN